MICEVTFSGIYHFIITFVVQQLTLPLTGDFMPFQLLFLALQKFTFVHVLITRINLWRLEDSTWKKPQTSFSQIDPPNVDQF